MMGGRALLALALGAAAARAQGVERVAFGALGALGDRAPGEVLRYEPRALPDAVVESSCGNARVTVLTDRLVRLEEAAAGSGFEDRATTAFVNRRMDAVPRFDSFEANGTLHVVTDLLHVRYELGQRFSSSTLSVLPVAQHGPQSFSPWAFGQRDPRNLQGTVRSLDMVGPLDLNCSRRAGKLRVHDESLHCADGLVSRGGWAAVDDSDSPRLVGDWWEPAARGGASDVYFFGHGLRFRDALRDFVLVAGRPALPPRSAMGVWWTRWYDYSQDEVEEVAAGFASRGLPLDVIVLDMNWHTKPAWTGYSWDRSLFPFPQDALGRLKDRHGLTLMANLHDASGVAPSEEAHADLVAALGRGNTNATVPFASCSDPAFAFALEDVVLDSLRLDGRGFDHWWIDWQQGGAKGGCRGGKHNPTLWLNRIRALRSVRKGLEQRDMVLGRWGGLGNHRYPVGFSADVDLLLWSRLAYQPFFTVTAANVAYGLWSHDITGPRSDPELSLRWIQWGAFSPIMRMHERGLSAGPCDLAFPESAIANACSIGYPWDLPPRHTAAARLALRERLALLPVWNNALFAFWETGLAPLRPLYFAFPEEDMAFAACDRSGNMSQYLLGDDLLVAPVVAPAAPAHLSSKRLWVPPGIWREPASGDRLEGPALVTRLYELEDVPLFVRAGAVIPKIDVARAEARRGGSLLGLAAAETYDNLAMNVYLDPSVAHDAVRVRLDDGRTLQYAKQQEQQQGQERVLELAYAFDAESGQLRVTLRCLGASDTFSCPAVSLRLPGVFPVTSEAADSDGRDAWTYDTDDLAAVLQVGAVETAARHIDAKVKILDAPVRGMIASCRSAKRVLDQSRATPGGQDSLHSSLLRCASASARLDHWGTRAAAGDPGAATRFAVESAALTTATFPGAKRDVASVVMHKKRKAYAMAVLARF